MWHHSSNTNANRVRSFLFQRKCNDNIINLLKSMNIKYGVHVGNLILNLNSIKMVVCYLASGFNVRMSGGSYFQVLLWKTT